MSHKYESFIDERTGPNKGILLVLNFQASVVLSNFSSSFPTSVRTFQLQSFQFHFGLSNFSFITHAFSNYINPPVRPSIYEPKFVIFGPWIQIPCFPLTEKRFGDETRVSKIQDDDDVDVLRSLVWDDRASSIISKNKLSIPL